MASMSDKNQIPVLQRAIRILESLAQRDSISAKILSSELGVPSATCYRILCTFTAAHWVRRDVRGEYHLSHGLGLVGGLARRMGVVLPRLAEPMKRLAEQTQLTVKVTVREGSEWLMIARHELPKDISVSQRVGMRSPVHVGSVGAALLGSEEDAQIRHLLDEVAPGAARSAWRRIRHCRLHRYAMDFSETHPSIHALSVPLDLGFPDSPAALTVFGWPNELPVKSIPVTVQKLRATTRAIRASLRG